MHELNINLNILVGCNKSNIKKCIRIKNDTIYLKSILSAKNPDQNMKKAYEKR